MTETLETEITEVHEPADWPTDPARAYADAQAALAAESGLEETIESRSLETESAGRIHYLAAGDPSNPPVLLLHGVSVSAATWLPMVGPLAEEYRVYAPDRPGRGLSDAPSYRGRDLRAFMVSYLLEFLDALEIERPHVVGSSLGGQQAFLLTLDHDRVDRLCLVGGPGGISREFDLIWRLMTVRGLNRLLFWLQSRGDELETAQSATEQFLVADDSAVPEAFYRVLARGGAIPGNQASLRSLMSEQGSFTRMHPLFDLREELIGIDRPTGFVWGTEDSFWPPDVGKPVVDRMPNADLRVLEGHGHMPWMEPGEETERAVTTFLDGDWPS